MHGVNRQLVEQFLKGGQAYTSHRSARRRNVRSRTYVAEIDAQWQADFADMQEIARKNKGARYLLTVIDVFFKYAWVAPVQSKDAAAVTEAFRQILNSAAPLHPNRRYTDKGMEFVNTPFAALMKRHNIQHFASESNQKAAVSSVLTEKLKPEVGHTFLTAGPFAGSTSSRSSWARTIIRTTGQLSWRRRTWTNAIRTQSGQVSMVTVTRI